MSVETTGSVVLTPDARQLLEEHQESILRRTDRMFVWLMLGQWLFAIVVSLVLSPYAWAGRTASVHLHLYVAIFIGGTMSTLPVVLALLRPGQPSTRYVVAVSQMLWGALLIHLTGGRIETHFHVFGSFALLAFYRDVKVLAAGTFVVVADHFLRGVFWPESVYGISSSETWRFLEHGFWVVFEVAFLVMGILASRREMREIAFGRAEQRETIGRLRIANTFLDSIVENIPNMIFVKDADELRFERINHAGEELLGVSREELVGKNDQDLFHQSQAKLFQAKDREVLRQGKVLDILDEPIDTARGRRTLHTKKIPIMGPDGTPRYLLGISEDITERKQVAEALERSKDELEARVQERTTALVKANEALRASEEQLHQAQKMEAIGILAGGVAHDFNNLLSVVLSYSELLASDLGEDDSMRTDLDEIKGAALRAVDLTRQLLAFSRKQVLQPQVVDLSDVVDTMQKMLRRLIGEDIELTVSNASALGKIMIDPGQLEQVIMNLAVNARDAMPRGGQLVIETSSAILDESYAAENVGVIPGRHVRLSVTDTGSGMDSATQARIFEPFFTTKGVGKGTGLGLSTVFGIVRQSEGTISVESEVGKGTTFNVYFPIATAEAGTSSLAPPVDTGSLRGSETILLVEDEEHVRTVTRTILHRYGYNVIEAHSGSEAVILCEQHAGTIDLLLTDVVMPRMSGRELAERLSTLRPEMKVLYMSGYTDDAVLRHGALDATIAFIQKPITPEPLARKVRDRLIAA